MLWHLCLSFMVFDKKSAVIHFFPQQIKCFRIAAFRIIFLFLVFTALITVCLGIDFFFRFLVCYLHSFLNLLVYVTCQIWGKFQPLFISWSTFSALLFPFSFWHSNDTNVCLLSSSHRSLRLCPCFLVYIIYVVDWAISVVVFSYH